MGIYVTDVDCKVEMRPGLFHPTPGEEQSVDLMRLGSRKPFASFDAVPIGQARVGTSSADNDFRQRAMVGMEPPVPLSSKYETWPVLANHAGDGEPRLQPSPAEDDRALRGSVVSTPRIPAARTAFLLPELPPGRIARVRHPSDLQRAREVRLATSFECGAAHGHFQVIRVCCERYDIKSHECTFLMRGSIVSILLRALSSHRLNCDRARNEGMR